MPKKLKPGKVMPVVVVMEVVVGNSYDGTERDLLGDLATFLDICGSDIHRKEAAYRFREVTTYYPEDVFAQLLDTGGTT